MQLLFRVSDLSTDLKQRALEEGFDLVGVASAGPANTASALGVGSLPGMHCEMGYMARTLRSARIRGFCPTADRSLRWP